VVAAGAVGAVGDAWGLYARVFYRYLARRMPGVEPLEMSAAIGMVAGQNWPGLVDAWELSVLNPGVSLDDAGDYLACVVPYPRRRVVGPSSAREALDLAHDAFDRERELLVAEVGVTPTDRQPGDLMTCGPFVLTAGRRAPWARELWVRRQQAGSDHGFAGRLEMTDRGVVDLNECSDPAARTCVEEWLRSADDPFADIVRAEAWRAATDAFGERPTPTQRVRLRYHRAAVAATTLPADRRGLALSRLVGAWRNAIHNDDPSCIPEPDEVRAWH
jgi:hypothetical protein